MEKQTKNINSMISASITITRKQKQFLDNNPDINFSGLVRTWLNKKMEIKKMVKSGGESNGRS